MLFSATRITYLRLLDTLSSSLSAKGVSVCTNSLNIATAPNRPCMSLLLNLENMRWYNLSCDRNSGDSGGLSLLLQNEMKGGLFNRIRTYVPGVVQRLLCSSHAMLK